MVNPNLSEEEQVEALKKWWKENGKSVVGGVVLGLGAVFGWKYWVEYNESISNQASLEFEQMNQFMQRGETERASAQAEMLMKEHAGTTYAVFAALSLAKASLEQGDGPAAVAQLKWALENASDNSLKQIARIRLVRILLSEGQLDAAAAQVAAAGDDGYRGEFAELRGDIAGARGDIQAAKAAYQEALDNQVGNPVLVQMKMDDLAANL
ncbi:MAG: tetratricopeptide repeat protein [Gammaproteobacteria bacterium]|nr:tetratricopeptide repeat protein [Gammaproteobacteria bacterium]